MSKSCQPSVEPNLKILNQNVEFLQINYAPDISDKRHQAIAGINQKSTLNKFH